MQAKHMSVIVKGYSFAGKHACEKVKATRVPLEIKCTC